jgi:hypothetical protein
MNWPIWLFIIVGGGLLALTLMTRRAIFIALLAVTLWLAFDFNVWSWVPVIFWILVILSIVLLVIDLFVPGRSNVARLAAVPALLLAVTVIVVDATTWAWDEVFDDDKEEATDTTTPETPPPTSEVPPETSVPEGEQETPTTAPPASVTCTTWAVSQSDPITTKWIENGLTPNDPEKAKQELLPAIQAHPDLLVATVKVFYESIGVADPASLDWKALIDGAGCLTQEGRDLFIKVDTLLRAQKWMWQQPCVVGNGTGITADGNIVMRDGLGRVAEQGCYVFKSVAMGENPSDPNAAETGEVLGSVSKFCGNINPPGKPPHIPEGPTPEPPEEPEGPTTTTTAPPPPTVTTVPGGSTTTTTPTPSSSTPDTTDGRKADVDDTQAPSAETMAPPAPPVVVTPPPSAAPETVAPGTSVVYVDPTPAPATSTPNGNTGSTLPPMTDPPASTQAPVPPGGGPTPTRP